MALNWNGSKTLRICGAQTICLSDIVCVIHTSFKCQLREAAAFSVVISCETVTVCSLMSSFSYHCNLRIRCRLQIKIILYESKKYTGFHPPDHIHVCRSESLMDDLAGSLQTHTHIHTHTHTHTHTHNLRTRRQLLFYNKALLLIVAPVETSLIFVTPACVLHRALQLMA